MLKILRWTQAQVFYLGFLCNVKVKMLLAVLIFCFKPTADNEQISRQERSHSWQEQRSEERLGQPYVGRAREAIRIPKLPQSWSLM